MQTFFKEPVLFLMIGGLGLLQAVLQVLAAFGHGLDANQTVAVNGLATVILSILSRMLVTSNANIPPEAASTIATAKAVKEADK